LEPGKGEITLLLAKWKDGDSSAFKELMPLVYPHLREVAAAYIRRERNPDKSSGGSMKIVLASVSIFVQMAWARGIRTSPRDVAT